jgi:hypothetical protein
MKDLKCNNLERKKPFVVGHFVMMVGAQDIEMQKNA